MLENTNYKRYKASVTIFRNHQLQTLENTSLSKMTVPKEEEGSQKVIILLNENAHHLRTQVILKSMTLLRRAEFACRWDGRGEEHLLKFCMQTS
jgi:hypothetical protein